MKARKSLAFEIDKVTSSIEEVTSGTIFQTEVLGLTIDEIRAIKKKDGWQFNWQKEFREENRRIYKLCISKNNEIQGLISIENMAGYVEMHLIGNAPHNFGSTKQYSGVAGNLVAFACKTSFDLGFDGAIAFTAKTTLVSHYIDTLGAEIIYGRSRMGIFSDSARSLVNSYFKGHL